MCADEYISNCSLGNWSFFYKTVNHGRREYVRDDDGDGFYEVHINGVWSLIKNLAQTSSRYFSETSISLYIFFEFIHNVRKRGKAVLHTLIETLVSRPQNAY